MSLQSIAREMRQSEMMLLLRTPPQNSVTCRPQPYRSESPPLNGLDVAVDRDLDGWNVPIAWRFEGALDLPSLRRAAEEMFRRHTLLHCTLRKTDGEWRYVAHPEARLPFDFVELEESAFADETAALGELGRRVWQPLRLDVDVPARFIVIRQAPQLYLIALVINHLFCDAYSMRVCSFELALLYDAFSQSRVSPLEQLPIRFFDYLLSVEEWSTTPEAGECTAFWAAYLDGIEPPNFTDLRAFDHQALNLPTQTAESLRQLSVTERVGINTVWEALYQMALSRCLGTLDVVSRSMDIGRRQKETVRLVGPFACTTLTRTTFASDETFRTLLSRLSESRRQTLRYGPPPAALVPFAFLNFDFPTLNFIPAQFGVLPSFGNPVAFEALPGRPPTPFVRLMHTFRYNAVVRETGTFQLFGEIEFVNLLSRLAEQAARQPDSRLDGLGLTGGREAVPAEPSC